MQLEHVIMVWAWMPLAWLRKHVVSLGSLKNPALKCTIPIYIYIKDIRFRDPSKGL